VTAVNRRGDTGIATYPTYDQVQASLTTLIGGAPTYAQVQTFYVTTSSLATYNAVLNYWFDTVRNEYSNQVFGNVQGARIWDRKRRRWFRIRSATISPSGIQIGSADDDHLNGDVELAYTGITYGTVQTARGMMTYQQDRLVGPSA